MLANAMTTTVAAMAGLSTMASDARIGYWPRPEPEAVSSATRCSTTYGSAAPPWGPSTDYFTSTSYAYRVKTQLLTPKPFTTSISTTSTYTEWETAPNNLTKTVYTDTYTWTNYLTTTETVFETSTVTTSVLSSTTVPTMDGFTPVQANYPQATLHIDDRADRSNWVVEDEYFQDEGDDPYILPFAMRGLLEEEFVRRELYDETMQLLRQFDEWKPTSKVLKDVKFRLEGIRSKL